jgi:hypothetical protein
MSKLLSQEKIETKVNNLYNHATWGGYYGLPECMNKKLIEDVASILYTFQQLNQRIAELEEELKYTDGLLKEATETIGSVVACCTYNSNNDAKIGIYGIDNKAFTKIDQFITHYNDAISAGKVSVDVKRELTDAEIEELGAQEAEKRDKK